MLFITLPASFAEETKEANWTHAENINEQYITWVSLSSNTLNWGDRFNITDWALGNFTIELTDLMKDATGSTITGALLTVRGENKKSQVAVGSGESQIVTFDSPFYNDEMKISTNINGSRTWSSELFQPNITVQVFLRGKPDINLSCGIYNDNPESNASINATDSVQSNKLFYVNVSIQNMGNATLKDVHLEVILTNFTIVEGQVQRQGMTFKQVGNSLIYTLDDLKVNDVRTLSLRVISPITPVNKTFLIPVKLTGKDDKNVDYTFRTGQQFTVIPFIEINKQVGHYVNYSGTDVLYVGESFVINIKIKNQANQDIAVNLTDSVPDLFEYQTKDNTSLNWALTIPAQSSQSITYSIKPMRYKESITLPKASAVFEFQGNKYHADSNDLNVNIIGAEVILTKDIKINQQSSRILNATVTVNAKNLGDQRVSLKINDSLPDNASLVNGSTSRNDIFLDKNEVYSYNYDISVQADDRVILPAAKGYFIDFRTYIEKDSSKKEDFWRKIESNQPIIEMLQPAPIVTQENISQKSENITPPVIPIAPAKKEERKTKLEIIKDFIRELIRSIMGKEKIEESKPVSAQVTQPVIKRIEETHSSFTWSVGWMSQDSANASGGTWKVSDTPGSTVSVSFTGTGVALLYATSPDGGIAHIKLDGKDYPDIDMFSPIPVSNSKRTIANGLENTRHTLIITVSGTRNPASSNYFVVVDAVEITQP